MIRHITPEDVSRMVPCARSFFNEAKLQGTFNEWSFIHGWETYLKFKCGVALIAEHCEQVLGGIGGVINRDINTGDMIGVELFWYVLPEYRGLGIRLLKAFEQAMKERGAVRLAMGHLASFNGESMAKLYHRMGYVLREQFFIKDL